MSEAEPEIIQITSADGSMVANFEPDMHYTVPNLKKFFDEARANQYGLAEHMIDLHLWSPGNMRAYGLQFDSELAVFVGADVRVVAELAVRIWHSLDDGSYAWRIPAVDVESAERHRYKDRLAVEVGAMVARGAAPEEVLTEAVQNAIDATDVQPVDFDSFYRFYNVQKVEHQ